MKKVFSLFILVVSFIGTIGAKDYFIDPVGGLDTNDGATWATSLKTLAKADLLMGSDGVGVNRVFVKGGQITLSKGSRWTTKSQNYYFSCSGTETNPSERELNDNDGNGTVESWEFKNPTTLKMEVKDNSSGYVLKLSASAFIDGLTVTIVGDTPSTNGNVGLTFVTCPAGSVFQNSVIKNCEYATYFINSVKIAMGCLISGYDDAVIKNCLIENNFVSIKNSNSTPISGVLNGCPHIAAIATLSPMTTPSTKSPIMKNVVIRNNTSYLDFTDLDNNNVNNIRGLILAFSVRSLDNSTNEAAYSNCLVYNNEILYDGNPTIPIAKNAALVGTSYLMSGKAIVRNCTFANNKMHNLNSVVRLNYKGNTSFTVVNNVLSNNVNLLNDIPETVSLASDGVQNDTTVVSNNVYDADTLGVFGDKLSFKVNDMNLSQSNTGFNAPYFTNPTTFTGAATLPGNEEEVAISKATWKIGSDSYLIGKGTTYAGIDKDLANVSFSSTAPAAGAYEYVSKTALNSIKDFVQLGFIKKNVYFSLIDQQVTIYDLKGVIIESKYIRNGESMNLPVGLSIIQVVSQGGCLVKKVVL